MKRRAGKFFVPVRLDGGHRGVLLAGGGAHAHADDGRLHPNRQARAQRSRAGWRSTWLGTLVPGTALLSMLARGVLRRLVRLVPLLPTGFIPPDDLLADPGHLTLPPGSTLEDTLRYALPSRRAPSPKPAREAGVHHHRRRRADGSDPFAPRRGRRCARPCDHQHDAAPRPPGRPNRPSRPAAHAGGATRAQRQGRPGRLGEKYVLVLAGETARARRACRVARRARPGIPGIGNVTSTASLVRPELIIVRPDFARPPTSASRPAAIGRHAAHRHQPATTTRACQAQPRPAPGAHRREAAEAAPTRPLCANLPVPGARPGAAGQRGRHLSAWTGPAEIDRFDRLRNINRSS